MNCENVDLLYQLSKGNHTTPADGRIEGMNSKFGVKAALFKQVMDADSSQKRQVLADSETDSDDDMSDEEGILELTDEEEEYILPRNNVQVLSPVRLVIHKRDSMEMDSPRIEDCFERKPIDRACFAKPLKIIETKSHSVSKSEESIE